MWIYKEVDMKSIFLGIKDWMKDNWHDWLLKRLDKFYPTSRLYVEETASGSDAFYPIFYYREGSIWHYIQQRKIAKKSKKVKK